VKAFSELKAQYADLSRRYTTALEMLGEKVCVDN
jgi:hypothetical protein